MAAAIAVCVLLLMAGTGALFAIYGARALIIAFHRGVIRQGGQKLVFSASPIWFAVAVVRIVVGMLAALAVMGVSLAPLIDFFKLRH